MICQPCRDGVHRGNPERHHLSTPLCPGGTWCCCQHRTTKTRTTKTRTTKTRTTKTRTTPEEEQ